MYSQKEKDDFVLIAESLKKYRRADLVDDNGKSILDKLYVDLLPGDVILNKCLLDNTTFLIGRKGTGKSTIFLKLENEYRKKKQYIPCYVDVKTVYESSQAQSINYQYLQQYFDEQNLEKYLVSRNFIQSVLKQVYTEIDKQRRTIFSRVTGSLTGNSNEELKKRIVELLKKIDDNEQFKKIEIPVLQQRSIKKNNGNKKLNEQFDSANLNGAVSVDTVEIGVKTEYSEKNESENTNNLEEEYTEILLKVFEIKNIIDELKDLLKAMSISKLIIMLDDVSEINGDALSLFIDTIVAPLNNWSDEFIKFKIAFYPSRVHYGMIDPGKIDVIHLDFYELYSAFDINKMEENAIGFTERLLKSRFDFYSVGIERYFDDKVSLFEYYSLFFKVSMNVPRIIGYILSFLYENVIIYQKRITRQDIENAAQKYYEEKIDAFFNASTYCLLSLEEKRDIIQLKKIRDAIVEKSKDIKGQIVRDELTGKLYNKSKPYTSHFHVLKDSDKYLESLELNHFISKYEERKNRDGIVANIYCLNYGLAKKNNIIWGKPSGSEYRTYFIERPFNFTNLILEQIRETKIIKCTNTKCGRVFGENEVSGLHFTGFKCPDCHSQVIIESKIDYEIEKEMTQEYPISPITKDEMSIVLQLINVNRYMSAREISEEVDISSKRVSKICKRLDEEKDLIFRNKAVTPYEYVITEEGKKYGN